MIGIARGVVINLNAFGATVRLEDGTIARTSVAEMEAHRSVYERAVASRALLEFERREQGRVSVALLPQLYEPELEGRITAFLKDHPPTEKQHRVRRLRPKPTPSR
ncbi:MAG: hypothetical protein ACYDA5_04155 [Vulcanimicrobiaceae bacterium]